MRASVLACLAMLLLGQTAMAATLTSAAEGRRLYLKWNCYGCHGQRGYGTMGPNIAGQGNIIEAVRGGAPDGMPSYAGLLSLADMLKIGVYLTTIGTPSEPTFLHWWEPVPSQ